MYMYKHYICVDIYIFIIYLQFEFCWHTYFLVVYKYIFCKKNSWSDKKQKTKKRTFCMVKSQDLIFKEEAHGTRRSHEDRFL